MSKIIIKLCKDTDIADAQKLFDAINNVVRKHKSIVKETYVDILEEEEQ